MIRTLVSFGILLSSLFFATRMLQQSSADEKDRLRAAPPASIPLSMPVARVVQRVSAPPADGSLKRRDVDPIAGNSDDGVGARLARRLRRGLASEKKNDSSQPRTVERAGERPAERTAVARVDARRSSRRDHSTEAIEESTTPIAAPARRLEAAMLDAGALRDEAFAAQDPEPLTPELKELRGRVRQCLAYYYRRHENAASRSPWGLMHSLIAYGVDTQVYAGDSKVNAIGWLCWNGSCRGQRLLYLEGGKIRARQGAGVEGHRGQFLAMLAQSKVSPDYEMRVDGKQFTVSDLVDAEKETCRSGEELTFKLIGLSHYLDSDAEWKNERGQTWTIPELIREELAQPVVGAACGGTHRMMGFSYAVLKREQRGEPVAGQWLRAKKFVDSYHEYNFKLQNDDGSFSTNWFASRGGDSSSQRRVQTTGHILEWLVFSLPDDQLRDPRVVKSLDYLTDLMWRQRQTRWEIGPQGHALHALALYDERVFGGRPGQRADQLLALEPGRGNGGLEASQD